MVGGFLCGSCLPACLSLDHVEYTFHLYFWHVKTIICFVRVKCTLLLLWCYCTFYLSPLRQCFYAKLQDIPLYFHSIIRQACILYIESEICCERMLMWHVTCYVCVSFFLFSITSSYYTLCTQCSIWHGSGRIKW